MKDHTWGSPTLISYGMLADVLFRGHLIRVIDDLPNHLRRLGWQDRVHLVYQELYVRSGQRVFQRGELLG